MLPILLILWPFLEKWVKNNKHRLGNLPIEEDIKIQRNILSSFNAIGIIILGMLYLKTNNKIIFMMTILYPIIFYIYDIYYIWFNDLRQNYIYIIHHAAAIYFLQCIYLYQGHVKNIMIFALTCLEVSNLPLYYVYHYLKVNKNKDIAYYEELLKLKKIQLSIYGLFRILVFSYILYYYTKEVPQPILKISVLSIYFMGLFWFQHQIKGCFITRNKLKKLQQIENDDENDDENKNYIGIGIEN